MDRDRSPGGGGDLQPRGPVQARKGADSPWTSGAHGVAGWRRAAQAGAGYVVPTEDVSPFTILFDVVPIPCPSERMGSFRGPGNIPPVSREPPWSRDPGHCGRCPQGEGGFVRTRPEVTRHQAEVRPGDSRLRRSSSVSFDCVSSRSVSRETSLPREPDKTTLKTTTGSGYMKIE